MAQCWGIPVKSAANYNSRWKSQGALLPTGKAITGKLGGSHSHFLFLTCHPPELLTQVGVPPVHDHFIIQFEVGVVREVQHFDCPRPIKWAWGAHHHQLLQKRNTQVKREGNWRGDKAVWWDPQSQQGTHNKLKTPHQNFLYEQHKKFTFILLTTAKTWKQPKCLSADEWVKKMWYIQTMEYYSVRKRTKFCHLPQQRPLC